MLSSDDTSPPKSRSRLFPIFCSLLIMAGLILLLVQLGQWTRERVSSLDRYTVGFANLECPPPPTGDRNQFLSEVQYLGNLPDQLHLLDTDLVERLTDAFACHPWVESVEEVRIVPPKQVEIRLVYRTPALKVIVVAGPKQTNRAGSASAQSGQETPAPGSTFEVDGAGILLRGLVPSENLPHFETIHPPTGPAGTAWGDMAVEAAARTAGFLRSYQDRLHISTIEGNANDLMLKNSLAARILWGRPPGAELPGEATADQKVQRLLDFSAKDRTPPETCEYDVRPKAQALRRSLSTPKTTDK
jgi:hypothetical protein